MMEIIVPQFGVAEFVADLARSHGVNAVRSRFDALADVITKLADDDVSSDETEDLIVALKRARWSATTSMKAGMNDRSRQRSPIDTPTARYAQELAQRQGVS